MNFVPTRPGKAKIRPLLLVFAAAFVTQPLPAQDAPLKPYRAEYDVYRNGKQLGSSRIELRRNGNTWRYGGDTTGDRGMASLLGVKIVQHVDFMWQDGMPRPLQSDYRQDAAVSSRRVEVRYDWSAGRYHLTDRKGDHAHALRPGTADRYGSGVSIAARLASGATEFTLPVAYSDGVREWRFRVTAEEMVDTPAGAIRAVRLERIRDDDDRTTVSWHDPARGYVAVRLLQEEDGDTTETRLRSYSGR